MNLKQNWYKWAAVLALILAGAVGTFTVMRLAPREVAVPRTTTTYYVTNGSSSFTISGTVYTVTNGQVALDDAAYAYYKPLIDIGVLVQTTATGSGVFVSSGLLRVGSGASADFQSGSLVTMSTTISGTPTFVGPVTSTGGFVGALTGNVSGNVSGATYVTSTNLAGALAGNVVGNLTGDAVSNYITSTNVISMAGATFSGPVKYGTAASYTKDSRIAHGFSTTPTMCMLWPAEITATLTITSTGFSSNTATHTNPIYWMCGK